MPQLPRGQPEQLEERNRELAIDADTLDAGTGERLDLAYTVDAVLHDIEWARHHGALRGSLAHSGARKPNRSPTRMLRRQHDP